MSGRTRDWRTGHAGCRRGSAGALVPCLRCSERRSEHPRPAGFVPAWRSLVSDSSKVEWIPEILQLPVVVESRWFPLHEAEPPQKLDLMGCRAPAQGAVSQEFL